MHEPSTISNGQASPPHRKLFERKAIDSECSTKNNWMTLIPNEGIFGYLQPISLWVTLDHFWLNKRMGFDRWTKCCILNPLLNKIQSIMDPKIIKFVWTRFLEKHERKSMSHIVWVNGAFIQSSKYKLGSKLYLLIGNL